MRAIKSSTLVRLHRCAYARAHAAVADLASFRDRLFIDIDGRRRKYLCRQLLAARAGTVAASFAWYTFRLFHTSPLRRPVAH